MRRRLQKIKAWLYEHLPFNKREDGFSQHGCDIIVENRLDITRWLMRNSRYHFHVEYLPMNKSYSQQDKNVYRFVTEYDDKPLVIGEYHVKEQVLYLRREHCLSRLELFAFNKRCLQTDRFELHFIHLDKHQDIPEQDLVMDLITDEGVHVGLYREGKQYYYRIVEPSCHDNVAKWKSVETECIAESIDELTDWVNSRFNTISYQMTTDKWKLKREYERTYVLVFCFDGTKENRKIVGHVGIQQDGRIACYFYLNPLLTERDHVLQNDPEEVNRHIASQEIKIAETIGNVSLSHHPAGEVISRYFMTSENHDVALAAVILMNSETKEAVLFTNLAHQPNKL